MSGFNPARKMKRTKQELLRAVESENRNAIEADRRTIGSIVNALNGLGGEVAKFQKLILAIKQALIDRRLISDIDIQQALASIEQFEEMKRKGLILGEKPPEGEPSGKDR